MAELKTKATKEDAYAFIEKIPEEQRRKDALVIIEMMKKSTNSEPRMWGPAIIGFGDKVLKYPNGRELDWFKIGFSPRKANFAFYISSNIEEMAPSLKKLGKYKTGKGCLYINKLEDIDLRILKGMVDIGAKRK